MKQGTSNWRKKLPLTFQGSYLHQENCRKAENTTKTHQESQYWLPSSKPEDPSMKSNSTLWQSSSGMIFRPLSLGWKALAPAAPEVGGRGQNKQVTCSYLTSPFQLYKLKWSETGPGRNSELDNSLESWLLDNMGVIIQRIKYFELDRETVWLRFHWQIGIQLIYKVTINRQNQVALKA